MDVRTDPSEQPELPEPRWVKLVQFDDGSWSWHTAARGASEFKTPEEALSHYLTVDAALK